MGQYTIKDIQSQAEALKNDIDNIYRALNTKIGDSPEKLGQVPEWILGIRGLPTEEPLTITPTIDGQEIFTFDDLKYNPITVEPVTSDVDSNIQPENIKEGVSILGVAGSLKEEKPEESFDVQPTTADQTITPTEGSVFSGGTVHAVTSAIDSNIQPENIKEGVSILGVAGTLSAGSDVFMVPDGTKFGKSTLTEVPSNWDFSDVSDASYMFYDCSSLAIITQLNTSGITNTQNMFYNCKNLKNIPQIDMSNVTNTYCMFQNCSGLTTIPQLNTSNVLNAYGMFTSCTSLTTIPQLDFFRVTNAQYMFYDCRGLTTVPQLNTSNVLNAYGMFGSCPKLTTVEGIDFSGLTKNLTNLFGSTSNMPNLTHFIVNGKINVSMSDENSIKALTAIDYDSVKSILTAAANTDNTNSKELAFNRTMTDQNGELAALVTQCAAKGWTITGLTLQ